MKSITEKLQIKRIALCLIIFALMMLVFFFSSQDGYESRGTSSHVVKLVSKVYSFFTEKELTIDGIKVATKIVRKLAHFTLYFIGAIPIFLFFSTYDMAKYKKYFYTILICFIYAISDELHQYFIPQRDARILDIFIDTSGSVCGTLAVTLINYIINNIKQKKNCKEI